MAGLTLRFVCCTLCAWLLAGIASAATAPNTQVDATYPGEATFNRYCAPCHADDGSGADTGDGGATWYPALKELVDLREPEVLIQTILSGQFRRAGEYGGHTIPIMPSWSWLNDQEIADVANYLESRWGQSEYRISGSEVSLLRKRQQDPDAELTETETSVARDLYFQHCVGCHGVTRLGASGPSLNAWLLNHKSTGFVRSMLHYGSSEGMPGWGVATKLTANQMSLLSRYVMGKDIEAPPFTYDAMRESWKTTGAIDTRPHKRRRSELFVALLHDVGAILLIDARSKQVLDQVNTDYAPHDAVRSANGRYLYVVSRGGRVHQIDLWAETPTVVAEVRIGFEARALELLDGETLLVSAFSPGALAYLSAQTLEPRQAVSVKDDRLHDIVVTDPFVVGKDAACIYPIPQDASESLQCIEARPYQRHALSVPNTTISLIPTDDGYVTVYDSRARRVLETIVIPEVQGAGTGAIFKNRKKELVWMVGGLVNDNIALLTADARQPTSWSLDGYIKGLGSGNLHVTTHARSRHIWIDAPLNPDHEIAGSVLVLDKDAPDQAGERINIAALAGVAGDVRVLHPQYNRRGNEVWLTAWNKQNEESFVVVLNDRDLSLKEIIRDPRLITPTRTINLSLR